MSNASNNVTEALKRLTPEQRAILEKKLQKKRAEQAAIVPATSNQIQSRPLGVGYPLSAGQERLLMLSQFTPDAATYNVTEAIRLRGKLDVDALGASIDRIIERHESLRSVFRSTGSKNEDLSEQNGKSINSNEGAGKAVQVILPPPTNALIVSSVTVPSGSEADGFLQELAEAEQGIPMDLVQGPLYRFKLFNIAEEDHLLLITMHHIVADAWSFGVLFKELSSRYRAAVEQANEIVEPLKLQYADFGYWQAHWMESEAAQKQVAFWQKTLPPNSEALRLPRQLSMHATDNSGAFVQKTLSKALVESLQSISRSAHVTLFVTLLAGFKTLLHRYSGQTDMIICSPTVGRKQVEMEELIGYFNNIVALRTDLSGNPSIDLIQQRLQTSLVAAHDHDELPFQEVASLPHLATVPLTRAMFTLQDGLNQTLTLPNIAIESVDSRTSSSDFDVALYMEWDQDELIASIEYKTGLFDQVFAAELLENLIDTLQQIVDNPTAQLNNFSPYQLPASGPQQTEVDAVEELLAKEEQPPNELETRLILLWQEVLGLDNIRRTDNFFELGGHSISAARLFARIEQEITQEKLPLALLFQSPTVAQMAHVIKADDAHSGWSLVVPLQEKGSKPPLFCIHAAGGNVLLYRDLANHLAASDQPVYGIQSQGLDGKKPILKTVEEMAAVYVEEILAVQPTGPYLLTGYCLGGTVAFDVAQKLMAQGHEVAFLGLLETYNWENLKESSFLGELKYQSQRAEFMVRNFMMLDSEQRQDFFRGKMERVQGRTSVWRGAIQSKIGNKHDDARSEDAILAELWESNDTAAESYVPNAYPGKITQFIPAKDYADYDDPDLLWDKIAQGGVDVHKLDVYPAGMVYEPFVGTLATKIASSIENGLNTLKTIPDFDTQ